MLGWLVALRILGWRGIVVSQDVWSWDRTMMSQRIVLQVVIVERDIERPEVFQAAART